MAPDSMPAGRPPRVLLVGRTIAHFSYYESIIAALLARGAEVEYLADEKTSRTWPQADEALRGFMASHPGLKAGWLTRRTGPDRDEIFARRELRSLRSYLKRPDATAFYVERAAGFAGRLHSRWKDRLDDAGFRRWLKGWIAGLWLRRAEARTAPDRAIVDELRAKAPDVVLASPVNMRLSEELEYLKAARALGLPTALPVLTWDNLSTKGLVQIAADEVYVWNEFQRRDAVEIQNIPARRIIVAGSPFFDKWFDPPADAEGREPFCRRVGLDPARPYLLYLGSSANIAADESWLVEEIAAALAASADPALRGLQMLVRPHPANAKVYARFDGRGPVVWPREGALPETPTHFADMRSSFAHAAAAVGINTSGMIDAVLADRPTFSVRLERYADTQGRARHFRYLLDADAFDWSADVAAFIEALGQVLDGKDARAAARKAFGRRFARPLGLERAAGDVIAERVLALAARRR